MTSTHLIEEPIAARLRPRRVITGMSAILLPHRSDMTVDWPRFEAHVIRTVAAGLLPAVNMDTGFVQLIDDATRTAVLDRTAELTDGRFVAGAYVHDSPDAPGTRDDHVRAAASIVERGGTPVIFPSFGMDQLTDGAWVSAVGGISEQVGPVIAFEVGKMFVPTGRVLSLDAFQSLLAIPDCIGLKHSSLSRRAEWDRLLVRDELRPDFKVLTGNDLAIDMVMYGSDYLLGLSTFAPEAFARRDAFWADGDPRFYELNDLLQYLGWFTFRDPVPGYRHDAAMFHELRGWATSDAIPAGAPRRPLSDRKILAEIAERLSAWEAEP